jgi:hypothetical protein
MESEEILELKNMVQEGISRGYTVFDATAPAGLLTSRLVDLLQEVSIKDNTGPIVEIYARGNRLKEFDPESIYKHIMPYSMPDDIWDNIENHYRMHRPYVTNDTNLVIALSNTNKSLIGTY